MLLYSENASVSVVRVKYAWKATNQWFPVVNYVHNVHIHTDEYYIKVGAMCVSIHIHKVPRTENEMENKKRRSKKRQTAEQDGKTENASERVKRETKREGGSEIRARVRKHGI